MKFLHIISETAFVDRHLEKYNHAPFENDFIFLRDEPLYKGKYIDKVAYWSTSAESLEKLAQHIHNYDAVILYYLDSAKMSLLDLIKVYSGKIFWSFYGAELYSLRELQNIFLGTSTLHFKRYNSLSSLKAYAIYILQPFVWKLKKRISPIQKIKNACQKIDGFIWYNKDEYNQLNQLMNNHLPPFVLSSVSNRVKSSEELKNNIKIIIGNSGSIFNNHIEALEHIAQSSKKYLMSLPINYGATDAYKNYLKGLARSKHMTIDFLEEKMEYKDYIEFINEHSTAVYASYRQMGLGNIVIAIQCNLKIYLSEKNPTYPWLKGLGLHIFSIENNLLEDLENGELRLTLEQIHHNQKMYKEFSSFENDNIYFNTLQKLVSK